MRLEQITLRDLLILVLGIVVGICWLRLQTRRRRESDAIEQTNILNQARREGDTIIREAKLAASEEGLKLRKQFDQSMALENQTMVEMNQELLQRKLVVIAQEKTLLRAQAVLNEKEILVDCRAEEVQVHKLEVDQLDERRRALLESSGKLSQHEARAQILRDAEQSSLKDAAEINRRIIDDAKKHAEHDARRVISLAIQRYAGAHTFESTTATVSLIGDDIKGRIIGREGRNIRAFEAATGITVLIDDTPNAVVLSGFDPVRREVAREAMQRLILDGRIHPTRIEEVVEQVAQEIKENIIKAGEDAVFALNLPPLNPEIVRLLGSLKFRHSFTQNILAHSVEVGHLTGLLASEIGADIVAAKRSGLLHDIGKALSHEIEGPHALVGADFIRRHGESDDIVNAVGSHHDEIPHTTVLGILVSAADAMSATRPGARSEAATTYLKRLESLEQIGNSFPGVEKCFAVHAGRELRIMVQPSTLSDEESFSLARNIVRKIEEELNYPGQIRVTVVRETRCIEYAK